MSGALATPLAATPTASPRTATPRRCLSWLGAVVLLVLIATAGLPAGKDCAGSAHRVEVIEGRPVGALVLGEACSDGRSLPRVAPALPRQLPRTRSVLTRGLPPSRAPTV